ncbi:protein of unknown function [Streptantibioticus cattleyicolor NRRL 8057 = DSM 46488]|nr:protein of unknown function [Streptantibioticus cattleyicolor NRRL 8057 = DSM 46488]
MCPEGPSSGSPELDLRNVGSRYRVNSAPDHVPVAATGRQADDGRSEGPEHPGIPEVSAQATAGVSVT